MPCKGNESMSFLETIRLKRQIQLASSGRLVDPLPSLATAILATRDRRPALIAEIKHRSPTISRFVGSDDRAIDRARAYWQGGATAISVVTEPLFFGGSLADIASIDAPLPILRKDFLDTTDDLTESKRAGASAVLLISAYLTDSQLPILCDFAQHIGLEVVLEVHGDNELDRALAIRSAIIGVNSRNLKTLKMEPETLLALYQRIPRERLAIAESGFTTMPDKLGDRKVDAVLVGSHLMNQADARTGVERFIQGSAG